MQNSLKELSRSKLYFTLAGSLTMVFAFLLGDLLWAIWEQWLGTDSVNFIFQFKNQIAQAMEIKIIFIFILGPLAGLGNFYVSRWLKRRSGAA